MFKSPIKYFNHIHNNGLSYFISYLLISVLVEDVNKHFNECFDKTVVTLKIFCS